MVLAHELTHNWQHDQNNMNDSLFDNGLPFNGKIFIEGFAQWVSFKIMDF